jgi:hypothetical protein
MTDKAEADTMSDEKDRTLDLRTFFPGRCPEREALFRKMYDAVIEKLIGEEDDIAEEEVFKGMAQHTVLMAIADLATILISHAAFVDDAFDGTDCEYVEMVDEVAEQVRRTLLGEVAEQVRRTLLGDLPPHKAH